MSDESSRKLVSAPAFPPSEAAFMLDFDGALVEIAPTPDAVVVPPELIRTLTTLRDKCGGALAIVTGRPIAQVDHFLPGIPFAIAGEHGVAMRRSPDGATERASLPVLPAQWLEQADKLAKDWPGVTIERKQAGLVLHFRGRPDSAELLRQAVDGWQVEKSGFHVQAAKMAWEIRPEGIDKGHAVASLLEQAPFTGRRPIFVGDDVTDLDGVREARARGGLGLMIPDDFPDVPAYRAWLEALAGGEGDQWGV
ncbi:trehalose-phosphatase [Tanticharoenia sakaeratensis]|uniref:Trehalose 6-phosphate phosphatase n=1 Tax=Tanticharoenia sakaeratensis NBRC 103193 TaxID=1231623 RepID=A0A0D6MM75_9PROT|nr:trehalose-phosphatase [Tanticharoenia sakaeratensis]GAN54556.1 HAD-superfamily hydrolase, subfamily IIB [Tanticharoenia sakaeratensis NBRC 103193]GBQ24440.1 trehalose phosphatase [Tanticharoenia sakaeratensis NBRC 103193]